MSEAVVNPDLMLRYADHLKTQAEELSRLLSNHIADFGYVGELWKDENFQQYTKRDEEAVKHMKKFIIDANTFVEQLRQKAALARQISEHRF